jgi:cytochrome c
VPEGRRIPTEQQSGDAACGASPSPGAIPVTEPRLFLACLAMVASVSAASANPDLARSKNCVACHHAERKMNGPSYKAIAEVYGTDEAAAKALSEKIRNGGGGVWGPMAMPAQTNVSPEEADALVKWILSLP